MEPGLNLGLTWGCTGAVCCLPAQAVPGGGARRQCPSHPWISSQGFHVRSHLSVSPHSVPLALYQAPKQTQCSVLSVPTLVGHWCPVTAKPPPHGPLVSRSWGYLRGEGQGGLGVPPWPWMPDSWLAPEAPVPEPCSGLPAVVPLLPPAKGESTQGPPRCRG